MSKQEKIIEVCGKKVVVRYVEHLSPCPRCVFYGEGCTCSEHCLKFDKGNGTGPYFVEAEQPESDFEAEYTRYMESRKDDVSGHAVTINIKDLARHFAEWERERIAARMRAALKKMNPGDVIACVLGWLKNSKNETIR